MARRAGRMTRVFVVDTSYLSELYSVPGFSDAAFSQALRKKMAGELGARFHVPVGCLYKLCDHIADVGDGNRRHQLARQVAMDVSSSRARGLPWLMSPAAGLDEIGDFVQRFAFNPGNLRLGLTNSEVIEIAKRAEKRIRYRPRLPSPHMDEESEPEGARTRSRAGAALNADRWVWHSAQAERMRLTAWPGPGDPVWDRSA